MRGMEKVCGLSGGVVDDSWVVDEDDCRGRLEESLQMVDH